MLKKLRGEMDQSGYAGAALRLCAHSLNSDLHAARLFQLQCL
jgi:hypothetical protein